MSRIVSPLDVETIRLPPVFIATRSRVQSIEHSECTARSPFPPYQTRIVSPREPEANQLSSAFITTQCTGYYCPRSSPTQRRLSAVAPVTRLHAVCWNRSNDTPETVSYNTAAATVAGTSCMEIPALIRGGSRFSRHVLTLVTE